MAQRDTEKNIVTKMAEFFFFNLKMARKRWNIKNFEYEHLQQNCKYENECSLKASLHWRCLYAIMPAIL